ncbi:MAG: GNAT family N-acetyltransferase [Firmicutes bacterium]|nr:GNAT family N-acetyltransferase [Bacillota bacterium]
MEKHIKTAAVSDAPLIAALADEIWKEHYFPMSGEAYVLHLLKTLQSEEIIAADIASGKAIYYLLYLDNAVAGYCAVNLEENSVCLSKLYVKKAYRQLGLSRMMLDYIKEHFASKNYIHLIVNKKNAGSIAAYQALGFSITGEVVIDAGNGFYMYDYVMKLMINDECSENSNHP